MMNHDFGTRNGLTFLGGLREMASSWLGSVALFVPVTYNCE